MRRGFTFVELLVAATMISILFIGLGTHLRGGLLVWQRATEVTASLQQRRLAIDRLERDLANAFVYQDEAAAYGSEPGRLTEPLFESDRLRWFTVQSDLRRQPYGIVRLVQYACQDIDGGRWLVRISQSVGQVRAKAPEPVLERLAPGCTGFAFQYAYLPSDPNNTELEWDSRWLFDAKKELPRLIMISVGFATEPARRFIFTIPTGALREKPSSEGGSSA